MPQLVAYILLTCKTGITIPQVKFSISDGSSDYATYALTAATQLSELLTESTTITQWSAHEAGGAEITSGEVNIDGVIAPPYLDLRYAMFVVLNTATKTKRNSTQYIMAPPKSLIENGGLTSTGSTLLAAYSTGINQAPFADSEGHTITSVSFGHWTRRQNIRVEGV